METRNSTIGISYWDPLDSYTDSTNHDWSLEAAEKWCQLQWGKDHFSNICYFIGNGIGYIYFFCVYFNYKDILLYKQSLREEGGYSHLDESLHPQIYGQEKRGSENPEKVY